MNPVYHSVTFHIPKLHWKFFSDLCLGEPNVPFSSHYTANERTMNLLHAKYMRSHFSYTKFAQNERIHLDSTLRLSVIWWTETHSALNLCVFEVCQVEGSCRLSRIYISRIKSVLQYSDY